MELDQIIASTCRQKVLIALSKVKKTNVTDLVRTTNSTYNQIRMNLEILKKEGVVQIQPCGNMKIVSLDTASLKTKKLLKALQALNLIDNQSYRGSKSRPVSFV